MGRRSDHRAQLEWEAALEVAYRDLHPQLVGLAVLVTHSGQIAEDLVHDVFASALRRRGQALPPGELKLYLTAGVLNRGRSYLRRERVRNRPRQELRRQSLDPADVAVSGDAESTMLVRIRSLPARQRDCVLLRYYLDLSEREVAEVLGLSVGSVKTHLHRAKQHLLATLEGDRVT